MSRQQRISSKIERVSEVLGTRLLEVPWHQRYYDWESSHVDDLLKDLHDAVEIGRTSYFLGSIMLVRQASRRTLRINDGQQRLITLSLILASLCKHFVRHLPRDRQRESIILNLLFNIKPSQHASLRNAPSFEPRITPPHNDKARYRQMIRGEGVGTNGKLTSAQRDISLFVAGMSKIDRERFHDFIVNNVELAVLTIPETEDAGAVFEALNARGKPLSAVDLIRNRIYSYFSSPSEYQRREQVHDALEKTITVLRNEKKIELYFRCFLQCEYGAISKTRLYADFRRAVTLQTLKKNPVNYVYNLAQQLTSQDAVELFRSFSSATLPDAFARLKHPSRIRSLDICLQELKEYSVSFPILFALFVRVMRADPKNRLETWKRVMKSVANLSSFVMRTSFLSAKFEPSHFDAPFAECAKRINSGRNLASLDIIDILQENDELEIFNDRTFIQRLTDIKFTNPKKARIFLFGLNAYIQSAASASTVHFNACTLEHILPQSDSYWPSWAHFTQDQARDFYLRSGNLTLLTKSEATGKRRSNESFERKKEQYKRSLFTITSKLSSHRRWSPGIIQRRSKFLAEKAAVTWRFN